MSKLLIGYTILCACIEQLCVWPCSLTENAGLSAALKCLVSGKKSIEWLITMNVTGTGQTSALELLLICYFHILPVYWCGKYNVCDCQCYCGWLKIVATQISWWNNYMYMQYLWRLVNEICTLPLQCQQLQNANKWQARNSTNTLQAGSYIAQSSGPDCQKGYCPTYISACTCMHRSAQPQLCRSSLIQ